MTSIRGCCLRFLALGLGIAAALAPVSSAQAQGFGPDPFKPYNWMYEPYTVPMAPGSVPGGSSLSINARAGFAGANQFEAYKEDLLNLGRSSGPERYGIGSPYFRSSVDSRFLREGVREYRPNRKADRAYEQTQDLVSEKFLAYFQERDPKRRAALIRDYQRTRRRVERALSTKGDNPLRTLSAADRSGAAPRPAASGLGRGLDLLGGRGAAGRGAAADRSASPPRRDRTAEAAEDNSIPPPPVLPPGARLRSQPRRTPDEVLNRSRALDARDNPRRDSSDRTTPGGGARRRTTPPPLPPD
jgi:hypothetical protein